MGWSRAERPFDNYHMGVTAENVATDYQVSRADQDALAGGESPSARRCGRGRLLHRADCAGPDPEQEGVVAFTLDEPIRPGVTIADLVKQGQAFAKDGTVTAGNAAGVNDAAAAVMLADAQFAAARGMQPLGRLVAYGHAGVQPRIMGMGPVPAVRSVLERAERPAGQQSAWRDDI